MLHACNHTPTASMCLHGPNSGNYKLPYTYHEGKAKSCLRTKFVIKYWAQLVF
jgi:hypothetical protein